MIRLAARTFADRWPLFVGTLLATTLGVALVHAGMTIVLGVENAHPPAGSTRAQADAFTQAASGASTLTGMTVMLAAFLTVFVVSSTFGFAVDERRPDLAALRLAGVTGRQVRGLLLAEAALVAVLSTLLGAACGVALTYAQAAILTHLGIYPPGLAAPQRPVVLAVDAVTAAGVCLLGAWGAARAATGIRPLDAHRRSGAQARVMTRARWATALVAGALTVVQTWFAATAGGMLLAILLGLGIVITASVALSRLAPLLVPLAAALLAPLARGPVATLAVANLRDDVRRSASCAAPMIVLVSLTMGLQGILDTQTAAGAAEATHLLRADLVATGTRLDLDAARRTPGVRLAAPETTVPVQLSLTARGASSTLPGTVVAVDPDAFRATHTQHPTTGTLAAFTRATVVLGPGLDATMIEPRYDTITLTTGGTTTHLTEAARLGETLAGTDGAYIDRALVPADLLDGPTTLLVQLDHTADPHVVEQGLRAAGATTVTTPAQAARTDDAVKDRENRGVMAAIVGLGSVYALLNVLGTLAIATTGRRRELATLRLTGTTRTQVTRVTTLEALAAAGIGIALGALAATLALVGLWVATYRTYGTPVIAIPWPLLGLLTLLAGALTITTTTLTARRATTGTPLAALTSRD
ncbi:FtsX-like permease family protein [Arsenicicoccus dermatophilus]|uniref:FtsX-like permease family protein n=1 Tax=Arsenicicoccus dermatophilus TaxID=1076331 RepID=UPI003916CE32